MTPATAGAQGASSKTDTSILNLALALEYLQADFYSEAEQLTALGRESARQARVVGAHERAHVEALRDVLGGKAIKKPSFNFRGTTEDEDAFRRTAVAFEDLTVAAYSGQAPPHRVAALSGGGARHPGGRSATRQLDPRDRRTAAGFDGLRRTQAGGGGAATGARHRLRDHLQSPHGRPPEPSVHRVTLKRSLIGAALLSVLVLAAYLGVRDRPSPAATSSAKQPLPDSPRAGFEIPDPQPLRSSRTTRWATVDRPVAALTEPGGGRVARLTTKTPEGTTNLVVVLGRARRQDGVLWVRVRLPVLPNGSTGWVPREALGGYHTVDTRLVVDRRAMRAVLHKGDERVFAARVGVGSPLWPTPAGRSYVRVKLTRYKSAFYGPLAFGTSARSPVLTDWPAGGFVGIHGTDRPDLIPGRVSHGCIRLRNEDILRLAKLMPVGTPITIT